MTEKQKLIIALMQIDSLTELLQGNEYQDFLYGHLINIQVEIRRQLSHYG
jgi:hypothetical protein